MAGRMGIALDLDRLDALGRDTPVIVDLKPSGDGYMEDLHKAGGLVRILHEIRDLLDETALTASGETLGAVIDCTYRDWPQHVVRPRHDPIFASGGLAVVRGNLTPDGAVIKQSAANPALLQHTGRAVVFDGLGDLATRIDRDDPCFGNGYLWFCAILAPKGPPACPRLASIPIPKKLARQGVKDMVRIDGRMSGTAAGTIILHVAPEAAIGGPLALVQTGDRICLDAGVGG